VTFLLLAAVFVGTLSLVVGGYVLANRRQLASAEAARSRLRGDGGALATVAAAPTILRDTTASQWPFLDRALSRLRLTERLSVRLQRAGVRGKPGAFVLLSLLCAVTGLLLGNLIAGGLAVALVLALVGLALPTFWLDSQAARRLAAFQEQLPDAIDTLVSAMRAGYSFQAAMKFIGDETPAPLGPEFARFYEEQRLGVEVRAALLSLQERVPSQDLRMFVTAALIQRETGGNLGEVLGNIADVMRQRADVHREIDTLTASAKMSARLLGVLPVIVFFALYALNPAFVRPMLDDALGRTMLVYAAASVVLGYWMMMKIARIDV